MSSGKKRRKLPRAQHANSNHKFVPRVIIFSIVPEHSQTALENLARQIRFLPHANVSKLEDNTYALGPLITSQLKKSAKSRISACPGVIIVDVITTYYFENGYRIREEAP